MHDHGHLLQMMDTIAGSGKRFIIHPHDQALMDYIEGEYLARGENTPEGYASAYAARDGVIWDTAIDVVLRLAEASGCPIHIAHMQTAPLHRGGPAGQVARHRRHLRGQPLGAVPLHVGGRPAAGPLRAVLLGPRRGTGGGLGGPARRDHRHARLRPRAAHAGGEGGRLDGDVERPHRHARHPVLLPAGAGRRRAAAPARLERVVDAAAYQPAKAFGLDRTKGQLTVGYDADIVVADLDKPWTITNDGVLSKIGWTHYDGRTISRPRRHDVPARRAGLRERRGRRQARPGPAGRRPRHRHTGTPSRATEESS